MIYLDNAATSGRKPKAVKTAVNFALDNLSANAGRSAHDRAILASEKIYETRKTVSDFFGSNGAETVSFCANCTTALNFVIKGVLNKGDHVVVSDLEHNAVARPLYATGNPYTKVEASFFDDETTVKNFENAIKENTRLVICTLASNVTGKILPVKQIGKICKDKNILFLVDGAQGAGIIPINMAEDNIDFLCVAGHKGLLAPLGSGILIARKPIEKTIIEGGNGINSLSLVGDSEMPEAFESGTQSITDICGIGAGIKFIKAQGIRKIYTHELSLIQTVYKAFEKDKNIILYTPFPKTDKFAPVLSFNLINKSSDEVAKYLNNKGIGVRSGYHCSAFAHEKLGTKDFGTVRISTGYFNNEDEIFRFIREIKKI